MDWEPQFLEFIIQNQVKDLCKVVENIWACAEAQREELLSIIAVVPVESEKRGVQRRDRYMAEYGLEVAFYPNTTLF